MQFDHEILYAFGLQGEARPLSGGQNSSVRVQNTVLKPIDNSPYYEWVASIIDQINSPRGYRLSRPIKSKYGSYSYHGWCCTTFEPGQHRRGEVSDKLRVAKLLHRDLGKIEPGIVPHSDDAWTKAHRITWKRDPLPSTLSVIASHTLSGLLAELPESQPLASQIVHSDLSGNILFDEGFEPLVIDFSPTIGPAEYAEAILVCDCIAWEGSPLSDLQLLPCTTLYREMIIRAVIFRLTVTALFSGADHQAFLEEHRCFQPIIDHLHRESSLDAEKYSLV